MHLQKRNGQTNDAVASQSAAKHLIHRTLAQECLDDQYKRTEGWKFLEEPEDHFAGKDAISLVDVDVDGKVTVGRDEFDDGYSCFRYDGDVVRNACAFHRVGEGSEDGNLVHVCHTVRLDDQVYVANTLEFE